MPHDIFGDVARPPKGLGSQAWYTVPLSILAHAAAVTVVVIVPLMATDVIPKPSSILTVDVTPPPIPEPPPIVRPRSATPATPTTPTVVADRSAAPTTPPDSIGKETGPPIPEIPNVGEVSGPPGIGSFGEPRGSSVAIPGPVVPPTPKGPVRVGSLLKSPEKVRDVRPIYPKIAIDSKIEGKVIIEAVIGVDGRVNDAKVLRSIPLLDRAALEAVQQWRFTPTLLNGVPVPVIITVTVDFKLD